MVIDYVVLFFAGSGGMLGDKGYRATCQSYQDKLSRQQGAAIAAEKLEEIALAQAAGKE